MNKVISLIMLLTYNLIFNLRIVYIPGTCKFNPGGGYIGSIVLLLNFGYLGNLDILYLGTYINKLVVFFNKLNMY